MARQRGDIDKALIDDEWAHIRRVDLPLGNVAALKNIIPTPLLPGVSESEANVWVRLIGGEIETNLENILVL